MYGWVQGLKSTGLNGVSRSILLFAVRGTSEMRSLLMVSQRYLDAGSGCSNPTGTLRGLCSTW